MKTIILIIALSSHLVFAHQEQVLSRYRLTDVSEVTMNAVAKIFEVERKIEGGFTVIVPKSQSKTLLDLVPSAVRVTEDIATDLLSDSKASHLAEYRSYDQVVAQLKDWAQNYPHLVSLIPYGKSAGGLTLWALKLSDNVALNESEPEIMITAATHGDELITVEVLLAIVEQLLKGHGKDKRLTEIVNRREIFFVPMVNADGYSRRSRYDQMRDPNSSYPYPEDLKNKPTASIQALIDFFHAHNFVGSMDLHAYGEMIMYPWAYTKQRIQSQHEDRMIDLTRRMAETNGYEHGQISEVIYVAKGSSSDYYYMKKGTLALAVELTTSKAPPSHKIPAVIEEMAEPTWKFLEHFSAP